MLVGRRKRVPPEGDDVYGETSVEVVGRTMKRHEIFQSVISPKVAKNQTFDRELLLDYQVLKYASASE